jgi:hypothetical protein
VRVGQPDRNRKNQIGAEFQKDVPKVDKQPLQLFGGDAKLIEALQNEDPLGAIAFDESAADSAGLLGQANHH